MEDSYKLKCGLAQMLKVTVSCTLLLLIHQGGVIMDVVNAEQARIAEDAGACAVMALERVPSDIRKEGKDRPCIITSSKSIT
jgi:pyridoxal 5'-phosphate synthase pdxS subunit